MSRRMLVPMMLVLILLGSVPVALGVHLEESDLFPDDSLDEWVIVGPKASFTIEDGVLRGEGRTSRNSFLTSRRTWSNFVLRVDVMIKRGNSGIQVRSHEHDQSLVGYQVEIDSSDRRWSGGLYDEGRRGWLHPPGDEAMDAFKADQWNRYEIACIGPRIRVWINGIECADSIDFMDLDGHIGFQVHSGDCLVYWRNARIIDLDAVCRNNSMQPKPMKPRALFNGRDLSGLTATGGGTWSVVDGVITGIQIESDPRHGLLWIDESFSDGDGTMWDFAVELEYKVDKGCSGFYFRSRQPVDAEGAVIADHHIGVEGIQVEVDLSDRCGGLYETAGRGWIAPAGEETFESLSMNAQWNRMAVFAHGRKIDIWVNGRRVASVDTTGLKASRPIGERKGHSCNFAFQLHGSEDVEVRFRNIRAVVPARVDSSGRTIRTFWGTGYLGGLDHRDETP